MNIKVLWVNKNECSGYRVRYAAFFFINLNYSNVHLDFPGLILSYFPPLSRLTKHSPSLRKASRRNLRPIFSNCMQNDVTSVRHCLTSFMQKKTVYYLKVEKESHRWEQITIFDVELFPDCCFSGPVFASSWRSMSQTEKSNSHHSVSSGKSQINGHVRLTISIFLFPFVSFSWKKRKHGKLGKFFK